jgi:hypothetical protein
MANRFNELKDLIMSLEDDFEKSYDKGNAAAGTRVRKGMQDLKTKAQEIRLEVQNQKNSSKDGATAAPAAKKAAPAKAAPAAKKAAPAKKK